MSTIDTIHFQQLNVANSFHESSDNISSNWEVTTYFVKKISLCEFGFYTLKGKSFLFHFDSLTCSAEPIHVGSNGITGNMYSNGYNIDTNAITLIVNAL